MNTTIIPDKLHVVRFGFSADEIIGIIIPIIHDGTTSTKISNASKKYSSKLKLDDMIIDNTPQSGYSFMKISSTNRKYDETLWNIVTPNNFEVLITSSNLFHLLNEARIEGGVIISDVVWIRDSEKKMFLTTTDTELYKNSLPEEKYSAKVPLRTVKPGTKCKLRDKDSDYIYLGGIHSCGVKFDYSIFKSNKITSSSNLQTTTPLELKLNINREYYTKNANDEIQQHGSVIVTEILDETKCFTLEESAAEISRKLPKNTFLYSHKKLPSSLGGYKFTLEEIQADSIQPNYSSSLDLYIVQSKITNKWYINYTNIHCYRNSNYSNFIEIANSDPIEDGEFNINSINLSVQTSNRNLGTYCEVKRLEHPISTLSRVFKVKLGLK